MPCNLLNNTTMAKRLFPSLLTLFSLAWVLSAHAQYQVSGPVAPASTATPLPSSDLLHSVELSTGAQRLSDNYGDWRDVTLRGSYKSGANVWQGEIAAKREFGQNGVFLGLSDTLTLSPDWFTRFSVGAGDGAFYLPQFRGDVFIYRKWLEQRNLVSSVGLGYYRAPDGHTDQSVSLGATYYFTQPWILEAGVRFNNSNPGGIKSHQQFVAVTYGTVGNDVVTARYGWGGEGYQAIASNLTLVNFESHQSSLSWRHWFNRRSGVVLSVEQYSNPSYQRQGLTAGIFHEF